MIYQFHLSKIKPYFHKTFYARILNVILFIITKTFTTTQMSINRRMDKQNNKYVIFIEWNAFQQEKEGATD